MKPLVALFVVVLLLATSVAAAEIPIAPDTSVLRYTGFGASVASHDADVVAVWNSNELRGLFLTRLDTTGAPIGNGRPLPVSWLSLPGIGWASRHFIVAGSDVTRGISALAVDANGQVTIAPRVLASVDFGGDISVTANGSSVLVTYISQTALTQTLLGVLIDPELNVLHEKFAIDTRELPPSLDHNLHVTVAADGNDFLIAWENATSPRKLTLKRVTTSGEVLDGPVIESEKDIVFPAIAPGVLVWWDREQLVGRTLPSGEPVVLAGAANVTSLDAAANDGKVAIAWSQRLPQACRLTSSDHAVLGRIFDAALAPLSEPLLLDPSTGEFALLDVTLVNGAPVAVWQQEECTTPVETVRAGFGANRVNIISRSIGPSLQSAPDVARDGSALVAVWTEQRNEDLGPRVYAAPIDTAGTPIGAPSAISMTTFAETPRIAAGGGRFLALWYEGALLARFVRADGTPDGDPFLLGYGKGARIVWDGARFVAAYSENAGIRAVEVSLSGVVKPLGFTGEGTAQSVAELAAGPGEVMALMRTESTSRVTLRTVALHGETWGEPSILATVSRPCPGLGCTDYYGVAIAWNGASYLAVYVEHGGPGRGGSLRTRRIAAGGTPLDEQPGSLLPLLNQYGVTGRLLWSGTEYVLVMHASQIASSSENLFRFRLTAGGTPLDSVVFPSPLAPGGVDASVASAFGAVLVSPSRAVVVYAKGVRTAFGQRVYSTTTDFAALPKQRAAGRR